MQALAELINAHSSHPPRLFLAEYLVLLGDARLCSVQRPPERPSTTQVRARPAYFTPGSPCTHCSRSSSTSPSFIYSHSHSYTNFCTRSYACPNQACAAFRLAVGSGARLSPKYSVSLEQLAEALRHCELQCVAPLELLFAELILQN